jgi:hypothetical protein
MTITITYGKPDTGWRIWVDEDRPDPGTWFFEARYHHSGHWKIGLDYRPVDGIMPPLWFRPFMWRPAIEIMEDEKALAQGGATKLLNVPPMTSLVMLKAYGEAAKKKKKLLFGSAEGTGAHAHEIKPISAGSITAGSVSLSSIAAGSITAPMLKMSPNISVMMKGHEIPYQEVLFQCEKNVSMQVRLTGIVHHAQHYWDVIFEVSYQAPSGAVYTHEHTQHVPDHYVTGSDADLPVAICTSATLLKMNFDHIDLAIECQTSGKKLKIMFSLNKEHEPGAFPPPGIIEQYPMTLTNELLFK